MGLIQPLLCNKPRGVARVDDRYLLDAADRLTVIWLNAPARARVQAGPISMQPRGRKGARITLLAVLVAG